jgi:hypothetical protein
MGLRNSRIRKPRQYLWRGLKMSESDKEEPSKSRVYIKGMGLFETHDGIHYYKVKTEDKTEQTTLEKCLSRLKAKP